MTISELVRTDGAMPMDVSLGQLHDEAGRVDDELLPCRVNNPELWFAESPSDVEAAKALCQEGPVRALCLAGAAPQASLPGVPCRGLPPGRRGGPPGAVGSLGRPALPPRRGDPAQAA